MNYKHLLDQAEHLAKRAKKKPRHADLKRSVSASYYALFHAVCYVTTSSLLGATAEAKAREKWRTVYRSLRHKDAKNRFLMKDAVTAIDASLVGVGNAFVSLQEARHRADYDPHFLPRKSAALNEHERAKAACEALMLLPDGKRRELALHLLFNVK